MSANREDSTARSNIQSLCAVKCKNIRHLLFVFPPVLECLSADLSKDVNRPMSVSHGGSGSVPVPDTVSVSKHDSACVPQSVPVSACGSDYVDR